MNHNGVAVTNVSPFAFDDANLCAIYVLALGAMNRACAEPVICETVDESGVDYEFEHYRCPSCGNIVHQRHRKSKEPMRYKQNYCVDCGQCMDWSAFLKGSEDIENPECK